ncbi:integral membrane protein-like protein [Bipolaris maydis]|nr:integral membrane protein-like protein [Bipolaris maydis]
MGKTSRTVCIAPPLLLTFASLICFLVIALAQVSAGGHSTSLQRDLYFFKVDTSRMILSSQSLLDYLPDSIVGIQVPDAHQTVEKSQNIKDFYAVGLFGYCEGDIDTETTRKEVVTYCSDWKLPFSFDPVAVWQLENTSVQANLGDRFTKGMDIYRKTIESTHYVFIAMLALNLLECIAGILAVKGRLYSLCTTIIAFLQTMLAITTAVVAMITYIMLKGVFESVLRPYNVEGSLGLSLFSVLWFGVTCSIASSFFWSWSVCFCSGK